MTKEFLNKLFEPFALETRFSSQKVDGTGLGMPIVKGLVQRMSSEITVSSKLGKGAVFVVTLPLSSALSIVTSAEKKSDENPEIDFDFALSGLKILISEDNEINKEIIVELLHMTGAETIEAVNGKEAVDEFNSSAPGSIDTILMDMYMSEMDGCTAAHAIRKLDRSGAKPITIITVTANALIEDVAQTMKAGMDGLFLSPLILRSLPV